MWSDLEAIVVPGLSHWQHPRFFGYFPSNGELSSVLGDYLSTGLGVLGLSWQSSPALSEPISNKSPSEKTTSAPNLKSAIIGRMTKSECRNSKEGPNHFPSDDPAVA